MKLSTRSRYGLRLLLDLALRQGEGPVHLSSVAEHENISEKYLGQLVIQLRGAGFIRSDRGKHGGYYLSRSASDITLREIVEKLEGDLSIVSCVDNPQECSRSTHCITREVWKETAEVLSRHLESISLQDLVDRVRGAQNSGSYVI